MSEIYINTERFAKQLELGMGAVDMYFSFMPKRQRLRSGYCGLVSTAIWQFLQNNDIESKINITTLNIPPRQPFRHVLVTLDTISSDPFIVDATYSQMYGLAGMSICYEQETGEQVLPQERILACRNSELGAFIGRMALLSVEFQQINRHPKTPDGFDVGSGPFANLSIKEVINGFAKIWDLSRYRLWEPGLDEIEAGSVVAKYIKPGSINVLG